MNILHTSDWHLGKKLYKQDRKAEHELFIDWLIQTIKKENVDVLIIAGDIFDSPTPPNYAQKMFFDFISKLEAIEGLTTLVIAGNHDSASLLDIPKYFFEKSRCYLFPYLKEDPEENEFIVTKGDMSVGFQTLPYFRNYELINMLKENEQADSFFKNRFSRWSFQEELHHKILIAHHGFGKYSSAGSEHAIYLSGLDYFPLEWLTPHFDYCALGHIHKKQTLNENPPIIYPGSPIPLRFSESNQKYVSLLKLGKTEKFQKYIEIPSFRKLIRVKSDQSNYINKLSQELENISEDDLTAFLEVEITLNEPVSGMADNIRQFIQTKNIELIAFRPILSFDEAQNDEDISTLDNLNMFDLFKQYYFLRFPEADEIPDEIMQGFKDLVEESRGLE